MQQMSLYHAIRAASILMKVAMAFAIPNQKRQATQVHRRSPGFATRVYITMLLSPKLCPTLRLKLH